MKKIIILMSFILGLSTNVFANATDGVKALGADATEAQKVLVRDGAKNWCEDQVDTGKIEEDGKEECVMDYFANHNLEEEPSCD
jgi:chromosome condensin MukBEF MukE localization factor